MLANFSRRRFRPGCCPARGVGSDGNLLKFGGLKGGNAGNFFPEVFSSFLEIAASEAVEAVSNSDEKGCCNGRGVGSDENPYEFDGLKGGDAGNFIPEAFSLFVEIAADEAVDAVSNIEEKSHFHARGEGGDKNPLKSNGLEKGNAVKKNPETFSEHAPEQELICLPCDGVVFDGVHKRWPENVQSNEGLDPSMMEMRDYQGEGLWGWCLACDRWILGQHVPSRKHMKNAAWYGGGHSAKEDSQP